MSKRRHEACPWIGCRAYSSSPNHCTGPVGVGRYLLVKVSDNMRQEPIPRIARNHTPLSVVRYYLAAFRSESARDGRTHTAWVFEAQVALIGLIQEA